MSCIHIQGTRRTGDSAPFRFLGRDKTDARVAGVVANAKHSNPKIRAAAAASPVLPLTEQVILVEDASSEVRSWLAQNMNVSEETLIALSYDIDYRVRAHAVWNPSTPKRVVKWAAENDANEVVRRMAQIALDNGLEGVYSS
jgi:hypothetical protein